MIYALLTVALLSAPVEVVEPLPPVEDSRLIAAAWCPLAQRGEESDFGCDAGFGAALARWKKASLVGFLGAKSLGCGVGWTVRKAKPVVAVGVGVAAPWDGDGVYLDEWAPVIGATLTFGKGG